MPARASRPVPLIALEGIPPLEPYLTRRRAAVEDRAAQLMFAAVLLERELYYTVLYGPHGPHGEEPPASDAPRWQPFPVTAEGRASLRQRYALDENPAHDTPYDLFGVKPEALTGLQATMGGGRASARHLLLAARFAADLGEHTQALDLSQAVLDAAPAHRGALALAFEAATWLAGARSGYLARAGSLEEQARRVLGDGWMNGLSRAKEAHELDVRRVAWQARAEAEGERFTRFLKTETEFCEEERWRIQSRFDDTQVPESLRHLVPLACQFGVGDDSCRRLFVRRATARERADAVRLAAPALDEVQAWVARFEPASYPPEVAAFFWLLEAIEEMRRSSAG
jgi:hypothetical protein